MIMLLTSVFSFHEKTQREKRDLIVLKNSHPMKSLDSAGDCNDPQDVGFLAVKEMPSSNQMDHNCRSSIEMYILAMNHLEPVE